MIDEVWVSFVERRNTIGHISPVAFAAKFKVAKMRLSHLRGV